MYWSKNSDRLEEFCMGTSGLEGGSFQSLFSSIPSGAFISGNYTCSPLRKIGLYHRVPPITLKCEVLFFSV